MESTEYTFTSAGMPVADLTEALDIAARSAVRDHGVRMAYIFDIAGEYGATAAFGTLEHALTCPPESLVGFGLAGIEQARPRFVAEFRPMFGTTLTDEYRRAVTVLRLSRSELAGLAANGVRASFLDSGAKQALLAEIDAVAAGAGSPADGVSAETIA